MNAYITDQMARERADRFMADAAASRRVRRARKSRRGVANGNGAAGGRSRPVARPGAVAAHLIARPFVAARSWVLAGQL
jgi:hypothetical protein